MKYEAVIFDLDGTLVDSLADIGDSMNRALRENGLKEHPIVDYRFMVGDGVRILAQRAVKEKPAAFEQVFREYCAYYKNASRVKTKPYPGIMELLEGLVDQGLKICVFSNKPHKDTIAVVEHFFPKLAFAAVQGQVEGVPVKPDPQGALHIASKLNLVPAQCLYCGDTDVDVRCAKNAGMVSVGVTWGFRPREELAEADYLVDTPQDILKIALCHE